MIDTKTADNKSTLLHHMTTIWQDTHQQGLTLLEELVDAASASKFSFKQALEQLDGKRRDIEGLGSHFQGYKPIDSEDRIKDIMVPFLEAAERRIDGLQAKLMACHERLVKLQFFLAMPEEDSDVLSVLAQFRASAERARQELLTREHEKLKSSGGSNGKRTSFGSHAVSDLWKSDVDKGFLDKAYERISRIPS